MANQFLGTSVNIMIFCLMLKQTPKRMLLVMLQHFLDKSGQWGVQSASRWDAFLDWLAEKKLLTSKVQSRVSADNTASLDDLRQGNAGDVVARDSLSSSDLCTNDFL